jgi:ASCH domain
MARCLSVRQPWAWAIIHGPKRIENRTWSVHYRGPILIHAARSRFHLTGTAPEVWHAAGLVGLPDFDRLAFGAVIGTVELVDCLPLAEVRGQDFAEGPVCWVLKDPRPLRDPVPVKGMQSLFHVPDSLVR